MKILKKDLLNIKGANPFNSYYPFWRQGQIDPSSHKIHIASLPDNPSNNVKQHLINKLCQIVPDIYKNSAKILPSSEITFTKYGYPLSERLLIAIQEEMEESCKQLCPTLYRIERTNGEALPELFEHAIIDASVRGDYHIGTRDFWVEDKALIFETMAKLSPEQIEASYKEFGKNPKAKSIEDFWLKITELTQEKSSKLS